MTPTSEIYGNKYNKNTNISNNPPNGCENLVLTEHEIKMLYYSKLVDMDLKHNEEQLNRFRKYNSYRGVIKLVNLGLATEGAKTICSILQNNPRVK